MAVVPVVLYFLHTILVHRHGNLERDAEKSPFIGGIRQYSKLLVVRIAGAVQGPSVVAGAGS